MLWILETTKQKKIYKHASLLQEKHKEKGNRKQPFTWSTSSSREDVLGFKEIYVIIFET